MFNFEQIKLDLKDKPRTWLITGVAGFIGSNILEYLLLLDQKVIGIDNLYSGHLENINNFINDYPSYFNFYNIDITDYNACKKIFAEEPIDFVLHHAAIASVPLSIANPRLNNQVNIEGFINILDLAKDYLVKAFVYASSSAVYGDNRDLYKTESNVGNFLSPYALSKYTNELYAKQYRDHYNVNTVGLRYFNIYGKKQDPDSAYAAVIPKWINLMLQNKAVDIYGDGSNTRDFCSIDNVIMANILACFNSSRDSQQNIYNIGVGEAISLNDLLAKVIDIAVAHGINYSIKPNYQDFIKGDIRHSCASIKLAQENLNYMPVNDFTTGLTNIFKWFSHDK